MISFAPLQPGAVDPAGVGKRVRVSEGIPIHTRVSFWVFILTTATIYIQWRKAQVGDNFRVH